MQAMPVIVPDSLETALAALADHPDATVLAGGTDLMVEVNDGRRALADVVAIGHVRRARRRPGGRRDPRDRGRDTVRATWSTVSSPSSCPPSRYAGRTVGSPQIRNAATIGGNLATASPAGDTLPVLVALGATVEVASVDRGAGSCRSRSSSSGPSARARRRGELVVSVWVPVRRGPQDYLKVGRAQRDGHRRRLARARRRPRRAFGRRRARVGRTDAAARTRRGHGCRRGRWRGGGLDVWSPTTAEFGRSGRSRGRGPSTTTGGPPNTGATRWGSLPAAPSRGCRVTSEMYVGCTSTAKDHAVDDAWLGESLLYVLRERLGFPGAKAGCEQGECGSCSVLVDGALVCACLVLAARGRRRRDHHDRGTATARTRRAHRRAAAPSSRRARCSAASAHPGLSWRCTTLLERESRRRAT